MAFKKKAGLLITMDKDFGELTHKTKKSNYQRHITVDRFGRCKRIKIKIDLSYFNFYLLEGKIRVVFI
ncbi:MAG: hypothetical protein IPG82_15915 [Saprospiraceae bacterium]|nr:hypothetical protein [Saprospiraceae bacterium]